MNKIVNQINEIVKTPGIWVMVELDHATGIWEVTGKTYYVTNNSQIIDAANGHTYDIENFEDDYNIRYALLYNLKNKHMIK